MLISKAPAKLILAGEHGVLYGVPAITTRIHWHTFCQWYISETPHIQLTDHPAYHYQSTMLPNHWQKMQQRHQAWRTAPETAILSDVFDLPLTILSWWQTRYPLAEGLSCHITSDIYMGCGLGSSASLIIAMLRGLAEWHQINLSLADYQSFATELEHFAHGNSSGLDVAAIMNDQSMWWQDRQGTILPIATLTGYLINTGKPHSTTSDCVRHVRNHHATNHQLWDNMRQAVIQLKQSLLHPTYELNTDLLSSVKQLQTHLTELGVVPKPVQAFTHAIEAEGWAGKQCGAGSISGDGGGFYWLLSAEAPTTLCHQFGYEYWSLYDLISKT